MTPDELYELIDTKNPPRIRPYKVVGHTIEIKCPHCGKWKDTERFSTDRAKQKVIPKKTECKSCQSDERLRYLRRKKDQSTKTT